MGKSVTLNWQGIDGVAEYVTAFYTPIDIPYYPSTSPATQDRAFEIEIPTGYMRSVYNQFYTYNAASKSRNQLGVGTCTLESFTDGCKAIIDLEQVGITGFSPLEELHKMCKQGQHHHI